MAYSVKQINPNLNLDSNASSYYTNQIGDTTLELCTNTIYETQFKEVQLKLKNGFQSGNTYYLRFSIDMKRYEDVNFESCSFDVSLGSSIEFPNERLLSTTAGYVDDADDTNKYYELVFTPNKTCDYIFFKINVRGKSDMNLQEKPSEDYNYITNLTAEDCGRILKIKVLNLFSINNLATQYAGTNEEITRIGIEGNPGLKFVINGDGASIGRRGYYEITEDLKITNVGLIPTKKNDWARITLKLKEGKGK